MRRRICKLSRARVVAFAVGLGVLGSLATAPASLAAPLPPVFGANCQPDGKISGGGATFQTNAQQNAFIFGYQQDVCGPQPNVANLTAAWNGVDPSNYSFSGNQVNGMVAYNVSLGGTAATNGSGAGLQRLSCRTDAFAGTDLPYNNTNFTQLSGAPGSLASITGHCSDGTVLNTGTSTAPVVPPPYGPQAIFTWPNAGDTNRAPMSFPVAGGANGIAVNLNGVCATPPTGIKLTAWELDRIFQGTINQWNDPNLVATNPGLTTGGCSGPIKRVVRNDNSGTTFIQMAAMFGVDNAVLCGSENATHNNHTWIQIATGQTASGKNNANWPVANATSPDCVDQNNNAAQPTVVPTSTGSGPLIALLDTTNGGIGYAELGLWPNPLPAGVSFVSVQTHDDYVATGNSCTGAVGSGPGCNASPSDPDPNGNPAFVSPGSAGSASNCKLPAADPVGSTANAAVGLAVPNWRNDLVPAPKGDVAFTGFGYPVCGITFDMVYGHIADAQADEVAGFTAPNFTPGCQLTGSAPATAASGAAQTIPATNPWNLQVTSVAGFPATGTITVDAQTLVYSNLNTTTNQFTIASGGTAGTVINAGDAVTLVSTQSAATPATPGITGACQTTTGSGSAITPEVGLTNDQLRTLYSYFTYVNSPLGQSYLPAQTYDQIPAAWLAAQQTGFQGNF
jgi:ABC-type phosphate transport system substrate-binding protein